MNKKTLIAVFFLLFVGNSDQPSTYGKFIFLNEYFRNKQINQCDFYYTEEELILMESLDKPIIDNKNFSNSFLLSLNTLLFLGFSFSIYFCIILHEKSKLKLASYAENINLLDNQKNCFKTMNLSSKKNILLSTYIYCDENNNYTIDKVTEIDSSGNIISEFLDIDEDGSDEIIITKYPNSRAITKCFNMKNTHFSEKCISTYQDGSKLETNYFYEGEIFEKSILFNPAGKIISELEYFGNKGFRIK